MGKEMGEGGNNIVVFFKWQVPWEAVGNVAIARNVLSEILGTVLKITDPANEITDEEKRERNTYLVLGTSNILSYVILTFSFLVWGN